MLVSSYFCREFWHFFYWSDTFAHLWRAISHDTSHISHLRRNIWSLKMRDGTISREINEFSIQLSHKTRNGSLNSDHTALKRRRNVKYIYTCISCASKRVIHQNILAISTTRHISLQLQSKIKCLNNRHRPSQDEVGACTLESGFQTGIWRRQNAFSQLRKVDYYCEGRVE